MQYSIPLPVGYDAEMIRQRVSTRRALFDDHAGLTHKSFLFNEKEHVYAPFYVWKDVTEARDFLLDDLFKGVIETFQRHRVRSWYVAQMAYGNRALMASYALREIDTIAPEETLSHYLAQEKAAQAALLSDPNLYLHVIALDADRWEILRFSLWKDKASAQKPTCDAFLDYDVLHVSEP